MKQILLSLTVYFFLCFSITKSNAQDSTMAHMVDDSLVTVSGFKIGDNQKIKIGVGSTPDGDFKFIRVSSTSAFAASGSYRSGVNAYNALPRNSANHEMKVIRFDKRGNRRMGYVMYPIVTSGNLRWEIDIDNAIAAGEVIVPDEFKPKSKVTATQIIQPVSVADELTKLKKLLDDGVITKEEYEAQKKKLLQ